MGEELFWIGLGILSIVGIAIVPIVTLIISIGIRRRQRELANEMAALRRDVVRLKDTVPATKATPVKPVSAPDAIPVECAGDARPTPAVPPAPPPTPTKAPLPSRPVAPPREPSAFETAAKRTLTGIWNWIIVGEEHRQPGTSVEYAVATNWLVRVGVLIVVVGMGFFLNYSSQRGWLGNTGKVSLALLIGSALIAGGIRLLGKRYHLLAQGLLGAGLATLYAGIFAAGNRYGLIGMGTSFALMTCVTVGAGFMSVRFGSMLVAILGIIGGYGTPVMLSTGSANFVGLYAYMLLLGLGVLGIAHRRNWHLLNALAFAATWGLVILSLQRYFEPARFWHVMPFLVAFFVLFSTVIFIYQLLRGQKTTALELIMLIVNAGVFFGIGYLLIDDTYTREWSAAVSLGLTAFYTGHLYLFMSRKRKDRALALSFISLAAFFLVITVPLLLSDQWLTLCWSVQALIMLWLAGKLNSRFLQYVAYGLFVIVFGRFFALDLYAQFRLPADAETTLGSYLGLLLERLVSFGVPVASFACAMRLVQHPTPSGSTALDSSNDVKELVKDRWALVSVGAVVFAMLFTYLHLELHRTMLYLFDPLRLPLLSGLWILAALLFLTLYLATEARPLFIVFCAFTVGALLKLVSFDFPDWNTSFTLYRYVVPSGYSFLDAGMRVIDYGIILAFFLYAWRVLGKREHKDRVHLFFGYGSIVLFFVYTSFEMNSFFAHFVPLLRPGAISVYWGLFGLGLITAGLLRTMRPLRLAGLALFAVVAVKVFFWDLAHLSPIYRIVAFILLGIVLLAGAFVYLRFQDRFTALTEPEDEKHD